MQNATSFVVLCALNPDSFSLSLCQCVIWEVQVLGHSSKNKDAGHFAQSAIIMCLSFLFLSSDHAMKCQLATASLFLFLFFLLVPTIILTSAEELTEEDQKDKLIKPDWAWRHHQGKHDQATSEDKGHGEEEAEGEEEVIDYERRELIKQAEKMQKDVLHRYRLLWKKKGLMAKEGNPKI